MFDYNEIIEFINRIINAPELEKEDIKRNVSKYIEYLELTQMTDDKTLAKLKKVISCLGELLTIKRAMGHVDIRSLLSEQPDTPMKLAKRPKSPKHYNHYSRGTSSGCGGSDDSYSDSCGGSSTRTSRC
jgi:hypothetical protein